MIFLDLPGLSLSLQDPATVSIVAIADLYDRIIVILMTILIAVSLLIYFSLVCNCRLPRLHINDVLEFSWILLPILILYYIALYSIEIMYAFDEFYSPELTLSVVGYQWYWTYHLPDFDVNIESRMADVIDVVSALPSSSLPSNLGIKMSNLEVDNECILPTDTNIRILVTAADVIHSWTIPSWGIKIDAIPGRINGGFVNVSRPSVYYGQCSELCGVMHGFMPIKVRCVLPNEYIDALHS